MPILVTFSVNLADAVTLRDLRLFLQVAEQNGADLDVDLREYDENNDLVGLAAVGAIESAAADTDEDEDDTVDEDDDDTDEHDVDTDEHDVDTDEHDVDTDEHDVDTDEDRRDADGGRS